MNKEKYLFKAESLFIVGIIICILGIILTINGIVVWNNVEYKFTHGFKFYEEEILLNRQKFATVRIILGVICLGAGVICSVIGRKKVKEEIDNNSEQKINEKDANPTTIRVTGESKFDGGLLSFIGWNILGFLITVLTFGICFPWAVCMVYGWKINHTIINGHRLKFKGTAISLFGHWILWLLLCIITLGIYSFWLFIALEKWKVKNTSFDD